MSATSKSSIVVTGGAGYLGSLLVPKLLNDGYHVKVMDVGFFGFDGLKPYMNNPNLEILVDDILHQENIPNLFDDVDTVIHLASLSNDPSADLDPNLTIRTNFLATLSLARRAKADGVRQFIFASSCSVYGANGDGILNEDSPTGPVTLYAMSKLECERELQRIGGDSFHVILPRFATLFGYSPRMRFDLAINVMTKRCIQGQELIVNGEGSQYRPFLHVSDAAELLTRLCGRENRDISALPFNVGSEKNNFPISALATEVAKCFENASIRQVLENNDIRSYNVSFTRLRDTLRWIPERTVIDGVKELIDAHKSGLLPEMDSSRYYNLLVVKEKLRKDMDLPNFALPSLSESSRWSTVVGNQGAQNSIKRQAETVLADEPKSN